MKRLTQETKKSLIGDSSSVTDKGRKVSYDKDEDTITFQDKKGQRSTYSKEDALIFHAAIGTIFNI